jgi:hypothetical protein
MYSSQQASCCLQWCFCFLHKHRVLCCLHSPRSTLPDDRASGPDADVARDLPAGRGRMRGGVSERKERRGKAVRGRQRVGSTCQLWTVEGAGTSTLGAAWRSLRKWMDPSFRELLWCGPYENEWIRRIQNKLQFKQYVDVRRASSRHLDSEPCFWFLKTCQFSSLFSDIVAMKMLAGTTTNIYHV